MPKRSLVSIVLTCEHAGNQVPACLKPLFLNADDVLNSHRGWDPGALPLARRFASHCGVSLASTKVSRLVVEPNRSLWHKRLFSEYMATLSPAARQELIDRHWIPHRSAVEQRIADTIRGGQTVIHLSVHTFTEHFGDEVRTTDIGLLYDPRRLPERNFCSLWREELQRIHPAWVVRRNDPYKGSSDGFTTSLRKLFAAGDYLGIELEVCQKFFLNGGAEWKQVLKEVPVSFTAAVERFSSGSR